MKKLWVVIIVLFLATPLVWSKDTGNRLDPCIQGYKTIKFGMSPDEAQKEIKKLTGTEPVYRPQYHIMAAKYSILGLDSLVAVMFNSNGEVKGIMISFTEGHTNPALYKDDYNKVQEALQQKYGPPSTSINLNTNDNPYIDWGMALLTGHVTLVDEWRDERKRCKVVHKLSGDNFEAAHDVAFIDVIRNSSDKEESPF